MKKTKVTLIFVVAIVLFFILLGFYLLKWPLQENKNDTYDGPAPYEEAAKYNARFNTQKDYDTLYEFEQDFKNFITLLGGKEITKDEFESAVSVNSTDSINNVLDFNAEEEEQSIKAFGKGKIVRIGDCLLFSSGSAKKELCNEDESPDEKGHNNYTFIGEIGNNFFMVLEEGYEYHTSILIDQKTFEEKKTIGNFDRFSSSFDYSKIILWFDPNPAYGNGRAQVFLTNPWKNLNKTDVDQGFVSSALEIKHIFWVGNNKAFIQVDPGDFERRVDFPVRYGEIDF